MQQNLVTSNKQPAITIATELNLESKNLVKLPRNEHHERSIITNDKLGNGITRKHEMNNTDPQENTENTMFLIKYFPTPHSAREKRGR